MAKRIPRRELLSLLIILIHLVALPSFVTISAQNSRPLVGRVIKPFGWTIPGLSGSRVLDPPHALPPGFGVKGVPIEITVLRPRQPSQETVLLYSAQDDGKTIVVGERRAAIRSIIKCSLRSKVFLYIVQYGALVYDSKTKRTDQSGLFGLMYYDDDGDGIFETRESGMDLAPDTRVPSWALRNL